MRTVSGSPCSACRMKLLTTRPSFMCILEPKVLKILATLTSTPSCEDKGRKSILFIHLFIFFSPCLSVSPQQLVCRANEPSTALMCSTCTEILAQSSLRTLVNLLRNVKISELILGALVKEKTAYGPKQHVIKREPHICRPYGTNKIRCLQMLGLRNRSPA